VWKWDGFTWGGLGDERQEVAYMGIKMGFLPEILVYLVLDVIFCIVSGTVLLYHWTSPMVVQHMLCYAFD
jgi:hypothetical protein